MKAKEKLYHVIIRDKGKNELFRKPFEGYHIQEARDFAKKFFVELNDNDAKDYKVIKP